MDGKKWEADSVRRQLCRRAEHASRIPEIFSLPKCQRLIHCSLTFNWTLVFRTVLTFSGSWRFSCR